MTFMLLMDYETCVSDNVVRAAVKCCVTNVEVQRATYPVPDPMSELVMTFRVLFKSRPDKNVALSC